jgi:3-oxoacyl-[acyl-carrier protein] reductase
MNIVVTGASRGIGFETAYELSRYAEHQVIALSRDEKKLRQLLDKAQTSGNNNLHIHKFDISNIVPAEIETILKPFDHIDIIIHNAGLLINRSFPEMTIEEWRSIFEVNVFGVAGITNALLPYLKKSKLAHIVNIGSMGGLQGTSKFPGLVAYSASKAALANMTECLAEELKEFNIRVNCLALGSVNTEMLNTAFPDYKAPTNPTEMARFISWFSLNAAHLMNGKIIPISINTP